MNKFAIIIALAAVSALSSQAACFGKKCCVQRAIKVGGCCQKYWNPIQSTENAPWKVVPYDIQMLSDDSLVKQRTMSANGNPMSARICGIMSATCSALRTFVCLAVLGAKQRTMRK